MRRIPGTIAILLTVFLTTASAQTPKPPAGMDTYLFGMLSAATSPPAPAAEAQALQLEHRKNMEPDGRGRRDGRRGTTARTAAIIEASSSSRETPARRLTRWSRTTR